ncbi:MAG: DUF1707 and DUF2154 domain-containing protein [Actinobacteria bacterium]|nr:DUF1707 and DUF2154 domain-containing protein [Actinomycetota bacterium]MBO0817642.1 DUF1707 and DUF2154 domain-containing protein [Actinomycetota bacterium]
MGNSLDPAGRRQLRVSDAEREQAAEIVRAALADGRLRLDELDERLTRVYAAVTYGDLEAVTADLPGPGVAPSVPAAAGRFPPDRIGGTPSASVSVAILSGARRTGHWVVPPRYTAVAIMGGVELDLRQARFSQPEVTIVVFALCGGVNITVPEDIDVDVSGVGIMGGFDSRANGPGVPGAPRLRVVGFALMGGAGVVRKPRAGQPPAAGPGQPRPELGN